MAKANGAILYRGPSMLDGSPILVVATGLAHKSLNPKTGDMVQTYIIADGIRPLDASKSGADAAVCGDCKHRAANLGSCYVTLVHGPNAVWNGLRRDIYPTVALAGLPALGADRYVRLGTYGDPMAVPVKIWRALLKRSLGHTGYSHQWGNQSLRPAQRAGIMALVMASVDTPAESIAARAAGYRYFRVRQAGDALMSNEIICPASAEGGHRRTCQTCNACNGNERNTRASIAIHVHGNGAKRFALQMVN
jgi:hypothetical protein